MNETTATSPSVPVLVIDGAVEQPLILSLEDFAGFAEADQVSDVSRFHPGRGGDAVTLESVLRRARPRPEATYLTLHAGRDDFHVSVPLRAVLSQGLIVYRWNGEPLGVPQGGPIRFLIKDQAACHTDELDDCANVKYLERIELTAGKGLDTRPRDDAEHEALHAKTTP